MSASSTPLDDVLLKTFGFESFRPGQRPVIQHLLAGRSAAAVFPTGGGKSLCYQLPGVMLPGLTLVVSPLIALMKDQIDALRARGVSARRLDSTLSGEEWRELMEELRSGELKILYVAPERFNNERFRESLQRVRISLFAIDEAHCISEWGHNFRPDYLKLARFAKRCGAECILALTATAPPKVLDDIQRVFEIEPECIQRTGFYRANLTLLATPVVAEKRDALLVERLSTHNNGAVVVYVTRQRGSERVAAVLTRAGIPARAYHAGMKTEDRDAVQEWFMSSSRATVVATIAFGMGIDKADIRGVVHYNLPKSLENYAQEIGRAGRDGQESRCEILVCLDDMNALESFVYGDTPTQESLMQLLNLVFWGGDKIAFKPQRLSMNCDIRPIVVRTLLTYLELQGYIEGMTPTYTTYRFKPLVPVEDIYARFKGERGQFLRSVIERASKARLWYTIELDDKDSERLRVVRALDFLAQHEMLDLQTTGLTLNYRCIESPPDLDAVAERLYAHVIQREAREVGRLQAVLEIFRADACQSTALAAYFGETLSQACGHCSACLGGVDSWPERRIPAISESLWQKACEMRGDHEILASPRVFTRFLCGIRSPGLTKASNKLHKHSLFGGFDEVPFSVVYERVAGAPLGSG